MCHPAQTSATSLVKTASTINAAHVLPGQKIPLPANRHFSSETADVITCSSDLGRRRHILLFCGESLWFVWLDGGKCVCVFLLLGQDYWPEEWDSVVQRGVWLSPSVHSAGSCAVISQLGMEHRPGRFHMALSENEDGSMTGQRSLEEVERCDYIQNGTDFF